MIDEVICYCQPNDIIMKIWKLNKVWHAHFFVLINSVLNYWFCDLAVSLLAHRMHSPDQPNRIRVFLLSYRVKQLGPMNYWINNLSFINILTYSKDDSFVDFGSCDSWTRIKMPKQTDIEHFHPHCTFWDVVYLVTLSLHASYVHI